MFFPLIFFSILQLTIADANLLGCFSTVNSALSSTNTFQTPQQCQARCAAYGYIAIQDNVCYCLRELPTSSVDSKICNFNCPGYSQFSCGGTNGYSVYQGTGEVGAPTTNVTTSNNSTGSNYSTIATTSKLPLSGTILSNSTVATNTNTGSATTKATNGATTTMGSSSGTASKSTTSKAGSINVSGDSLLGLLVTILFII